MTLRVSRLLALVLLHACSSADTTELSVNEPLARLHPIASGTPLAPRAPTSRVLDEGRGTTARDVENDAVETGNVEGGALPTSNAFDGPLDPTGAGSASPNDAGSAQPLPCLLRLEWTGLEASHEGCQSLSGLPAAELAVWDGSRLQLLGAEWIIEENRLERTRRCQHEGGQLWRFAEQLELARSLPSRSCPGAAIEARYAYDECPLLSPGTVCAAGEPSACQLTGTLRLTPASADPAEAKADAEALAAPELEASCRPVGRDPRQPVAPGERCYDGECSAGHFCSRELDAEACAPLGEGICAPAPTSFDCGHTQQNLCLCTDPPMPLNQLPPFDPTRPDALTPNACNAHALGLSTTFCPAG